MTIAPSRTDLGGRQSPRYVTDEWLTPQWILDALGAFALDPCAAPEPRPHPTAARHISRPDDGLSAPWEGRVFLNPPYKDAGKWVARLAAHGRGTALVFARTETAWFQAHVWGHASAVLFLEGRVSFCRMNGRQPYGHNAAAPSVLAAYGSADAAALAASGIRGALVTGWTVRAEAAGNVQPVLFGEAS